MTAAIDANIDQAESDATQPASTIGQPRRILVADDEHLVASGLAATLTSLGYEVVGPVSDGEQAIALCAADPPDLALLDIRMPKLDGLAAAKEIFGRHGVPIVIFSAYSDRQYVETGNRIGVFGYLLKPVTADQLRVGVSVAWGRYLDYAEKNREIARLEDRLASRRVVEQAKWVIVKHRNISEPEALKLLQRQARRNRRPLVEVAQNLLDNEALLNDEQE